MATEFDEFVNRRLETCEQLPEGVDRLECCQAKQLSVCPPALNIDFDHPANIRSEGGGFSAVAIPLALLIVFTGMLFAAWRYRLLQRLWSKFNEELKAFVTGWAIWVLLVVSFIALLDPFDGEVRQEDYGVLLRWLLLPPVSVFVVFRWFRRFVWRK